MICDDEVVRCAQRTGLRIRAKHDQRMSGCRPIHVEVSSRRFAQVVLSCQRVRLAEAHAAAVAVNAKRRADGMPPLMLPPAPPDPASYAEQPPVPACGMASAQNDPRAAPVFVPPLDPEPPGCVAELTVIGKGLIDDDQLRPARRAVYSFVADTQACVWRLVDPCRIDLCV